MISSHFTALARHALFLCVFGSLVLHATEERALLVPVEEGIHRIQVEIWDAEAGDWIVYSIAHLDGTAGTVKLRVPLDIPSERLRVRATVRALVPRGWIDDDSTLHSRRTFETDGYTSRETPGILGTIDADGAFAANDDLVVESDIWKLSGDELYFFNQRRGLQVFDVADPSAPVLNGTLRYPARGEQMYQLDTDHVLLLARGREDTQVELVRLHDGAPYIAETLTGMPGFYVESRLIASRLYVVTESGHYGPAEENGSRPWIRTLHVNGFDLADPAAPVDIGELVLDLNQGWGYVLTATNDTLILSANQYLYEDADSDRWAHGWHYESMLYLVDLTAEDGVPYVKASTPLAGRTIDKFKLRLSGDTLTAITQAQGYRLVTETVEIPNPDYPPEGEPGADGIIGDPPPDDIPPTITATRTHREWYRNSVLENFQLDGDTLIPVGRLELAKDENLRATRFDGNRAYIVTFEQIDPLFAVDLSDPADPAILGKLEIPGWSTYLQILDHEQLFSIGVENGRVALSLFDVADAANMSLLNRVYLGPEGEYSWAEGNYDEKAISLFPEQGLALVPYQSYNYKDGWSGYTKALQVVELAADKLVLRGTLQAGDRVRRASLLEDDTVVSVSNEELLTASLADPDAPALLADLPISWSTDELFVLGDYLLQIERPQGSPYYYGFPEVYDSAAADRPILRVSPADQADQLILEFPLESGSLRGITVRGGILYALYLDYQYDYNEDSTPLSNYRLETYDLSNPLEPSHPGTARIDFELPRYYWSDSALQAAWKDDHTLVWMPPAQANHTWWAWDWFGGPRLGLIDCFCWLPIGANEAHVLVADVSSPSEPRFADGINLTRQTHNGSMAYSAAFLVADQVALTESYHWWEPIEETNPDKPDRIFYRYENHVENNLLTVAIDAEGHLGKPFMGEIVGTMTGAIPLEDGAFLALTRDREVTPADDESGRTVQQTRLFAQLFDGSQILPIDQIALGPDNAYDDSQLSFAFADRVIYRAGHDYAPELDRLSEIERIHFANTGKLEWLEPLVTPNVYRHELDILDRHLLERNEVASTLWKIDGTTAQRVGTFDPPTIATWWGWVWNQPGDPAVVPGAGLWLPAGAYGVDYFELDPLEEPAAGASTFLSRHAATDWEEIATSACAESTLVEADAVGPMEELRWRFKAANFTAADDGALDYGDYWYQSAWYGWYHQRGDSQWIYHLTHGWQWITRQGNGTWLYDGQLGWCWTQDVTYPYLYSAQRKSWLFFFEDGDSGTNRWFYDFGAADWFSVGQS